MSTGEAAETPHESKPGFGDAANKLLEDFKNTGVLAPLNAALTTSVENSKKLIDQGHNVAAQGPVYAMVFLSVALIAFSISFGELHSKDSADFIAGLVIASVLLIVAGILRLINNVAESRAAAQQVSELSAANERILKYAIEHGAVLTVRQPEEQPAPPPGS